MFVTVPNPTPCQNLIAAYTLLKIKKKEAPKRTPLNNKGWKKGVEILFGQYSADENSFEKGFETL
jgi:hypothetical protein